MFLVLADIEQQVREVEETGFDIDAAVEESLDLPPLAEPPLTLNDLDRAINFAPARPAEIDWKPLDPRSYGIGLPGGESVRVTTDAKVFDFSGDNHQLFSADGEVFQRFCIESESAGAGNGVAWILQRSGGGLEFVVATRFGLRTVQNFGELMSAVESIGEPTDFPLADWPGVTVHLVA